MPELADLPKQSAERPQRLLARLSTWNALVLTLGFLVLLIATLEWREYRRTQDDLQVRAHTAATLYAGRLGGRLDAQFAALRFLASTLRERGADALAQPGGQPSQTLREFLRLNPGLSSVELLSPDGGTVIGSAGSTRSAHPLIDAEFTPVLGQANATFGVASRGEPDVVSLRYRETDAAGHVLFLLRARYRISALLASTNDFSTPWTLSTVDARANRAIGRWKEGGLFLNEAQATGHSHVVQQVEVRGYPLPVAAALPPGYGTARWVSASLKRWGIEALLLASMAALLLLVRHNRRQGERQRRDLQAAAEKDPLTGLFNREGLEAQVAALSKNLPPTRQLAVIVLDLYRFSEINARWGRAAGNRVLMQLAERLRKLPEVKVLARIGADAFALVYHDIALDNVQARMETVIRSVTPPFLVQQDFSRKITASVGCALFPEDTTQPQALLGLAEAALFTRTERENTARVTEIDPYGPSSAALLSWAGRFLGRRAAAMTETFYKQIALDPQNTHLLELLSPEEFTLLKSRQAHYLRQFTSPALSAETHRQRAVHLGEVHALVGVSTGALISANSAHHRSLVDLSKRIPGRLSQKEFLNRVLYLRLENDLSMQAEAALALQLRLQKGVRELSHILHVTRQWADVMDRILEHVETWPFIAGCAIYSQNVAGEFVIEAQNTGHGNLSVGWLSSTPGATPLPAANMIEAAWLNNDVASLPTLRNAGLARSAAAVPLLDAQSHAHALLVLYGKLPNQFETPWMRDVLGSLRGVFTESLQRLRTEPSQHLSADERAQWRARLFSGGLQMYMQPIINLKHGRCTKVEALARLKLEDGRIIGPGAFLPALSEQELNRLFIEGLQQAIAALAKWDAMGFELELSFNLPPSSLRHPDCVRRIRAALAPYPLAPQRLTFELLENEEIGDITRYTEAIFDLHALGVRLAMDDLGSGYSSLLRLRNLPFDLIKIDQGLLYEADKAPHRTISLVGSLIKMAHSMDLQIAMEGLQNADLVETARILGADLAQGYTLAQPMPAADIPGWIARFLRLPDQEAPRTVMGVMATHWLWEQGVQDRFSPDPANAHLQCRLGQFLARRGLATSEVAALHRQMHQTAQTQGTEHMAYQQVRNRFYELFTAEGLRNVAPSA